MPNFMERVRRVVDETMRALASTRLTDDPAAGAKHSRATSLIGSASKHHGRMKRRYDRISINQAALIMFHGGQDEVACVVRDVSPGGAGLSVASTVGIPDQFILAVKR